MWAAVLGFAVWPREQRVSSRRLASCRYYYCQSACVARPDTFSPPSSFSLALLHSHRSQLPPLSRLRLLVQLSPTHIRLLQKTCLPNRPP